MGVLKTIQTRREDKVFGIIDNVMKQVFGEPATRLIYNHLEQRYSLRHCKISEKIDVFADCLQDFLKDAAYPIENRILNDLCSACGVQTGISLQIAVPEECEATLNV
jgi:hypothetical protein